MSFIDLFDFSEPSKYDNSQESPTPSKESPATPARNPTTKGVLKEPSPDSVAKRRRHAVYMERPPVWLLNDPPVDGRTSTGGTDGNILCGCCGNAMKQGIQACSAGVCLRDSAHDTDTRDVAAEESAGEHEAFRQELLCDIAAAVAEVHDSNSDPETPLLSPFSEPTKRQCDYFFAANDQSPNSSEEDLPSRLQSPLRQKKAGLCTRLHSYRDIRLEVGEKWAIQEGSLVVCVDPSYTQFGRQREQLPDEFDIVTGDFYIICSLYADLWALCLKISFATLAEDDMEESTRCSTQLGFLPLCAVTLAANFSSFCLRCVNGVQHPGNGRPVMPPERSHSLNASKQFFQGDRLHIGLPSAVYDTCDTLSLECVDKDFIPLDSTLQHLFSDIGARRDRVQQLGKRMSIRKLWRGTRAPKDVPFQAPDRERRVSFRDYSGSRSSGDGDHHRWSSYSSTASQGKKSPRVSFRDRGIWGLMGGHSRGNSTASDPLGYYL